MLSYTALAVTIAEADAYVAARGVTGWPAQNADKGTALRRGQDWVARTFNDVWAVEFNDATAPVEVKHAVIEAALSEARSPGVLAPTVKATDAKVLTGVGSIQWQPVPGPRGVDALRARLLHVEDMLAGKISRSPYGGGTKFLVRA